MTRTLLIATLVCWSGTAFGVESPPVGPAWPVTVPGSTCGGIAALQEAGSVKLTLGVYKDVALQGGSGSSATVDLTVTSSGYQIILSNDGNGYKTGDKMSITIGGTTATLGTIVATHNHYPIGYKFDPHHPPRDPCGDHISAAPH